MGSNIHRDDPYMGLGLPRDIPAHQQVCRDYPRSDWRSNAYAQPRQAQDAYTGGGSGWNANHLLCPATVATNGVFGGVGGAWAGAQGGAKYCPKNPTYPACVAGSVAGGATVGIATGITNGLNSASCQDVIQRDTRGQCHGAGGAVPGCPHDVHYGANQ